MTAFVRKVSRRMGINMNEKKMGKSHENKKERNLKK